jgi:glyoxylase-like metal-dependent hydrolase (beta-lactamase superfamily II)
MKIIDTKMHGREGITGTFLVRGEQTALIESGPKSSLENVLAGLDEAGVERLDWVVVTHIHLDHAGAAGSLALRFPEAKIAVHEVGAPHLVDPSKLWSSASRIYGDDMDRLWGGIDPIPADRIHPLTDGDKIDLGGRVLQAVETPGHARHHHAILDNDTGTLFTGDAMGVRLQDVGIMRPATPPPEFNLEDAVASIERIRAMKPEALCLTHYGPVDDVDRTCAEAVDALERWAQWVRTARRESHELDEVAKFVRREAEASFSSEVLSGQAIERMEQTTSYRMNTMGYMRYFDKLEKSDR